ncbi:signal recognition particle-docking protein FtsY [Candidatus Micrarchaeota archaeon]|nr:signal recognition particle-docking protein FtsY [Candidatus Micrarchaeota archaeon]
MFDLLKKKISSFVSSLTKKEEEKPVEQPQPVQAAVAEEKPVEAPKAVPTPVEESKAPKEERKQAIVSEPVEAPKAVEKPRELPTPKPVQEIKKPVPDVPPAPKEEKQRELAPKLGILTKLKSVFTNEITISDKETEELFGELEIALLESDVTFDTAQFLVTDLKRRLVGKKVHKDRVQDEIRAEVGAALLQTLSSAKPVDVVELVRVRKKEGSPFVILFVGPNGAGKTTTIAKVAYLLKNSGFTPVISASDTFRAAALEQAIHHGEKLGVRVIRQSYGADPAAVAFDAVSHAKSVGADCVLIDTAGRQETNVNLVKEMEKINRVVKPDLKVFVGEAVSGNALVEQVKKFHEAIGIDALVLTKLDCDAKGGNSLSIAYETKLPVMFLGTGQSYDELIPFNPDYIVQKVLAA